MKENGSLRVQREQSKGKADLERERGKCPNSITEQLFHTEKQSED